MQCPVCDAKLREVHKYGVEVDICPDCKGVWLDRGELEKIMEMEALGGPVERREPQREEQKERPRERYEERDDREYRDYNRDDYDRGRPRKKKKESWFSEIFESFGGD